jgi:hypothetical protein
LASNTHYSNVLPLTSDKLSRFDRLRTDVWSTSFFEGREFRISREINIPSSTTQVLKLVSLVDTIITLTTIDIEAGFMRAAVAVAGTEGGSFSTPITVFSANGMTPGENRRSTYNGNNTPYITQHVWSTGGTHTGGIETEVVRIKAGNNANSATTVGGIGLQARGIPPGTFYIRLQNLSTTDAITGVFRMRWEERPNL